MDAVLLLSDHAAVADGKLYVNGGAWNQVAAGRPIQIGLAVKLEVPWTATNVPHIVVVRLVTEDGQPVLDPEGQQWRAEAKFEVGRPPGVKQGVPQDVPLAINFPGLAVAEGGYRWELLVDDEISAIARFRAIG